MRKVLIAIASELDGHAGADAIQTTIPSFTKANIIKIVTEKVIDEEEPTEVEIHHVRNQGNNVWEVHGTVYDQDFAAMVAPIAFVHIATRTG